MQHTSYELLSVYSTSRNLGSQVYHMEIERLCLTPLTTHMHRCMDKNTCHALTKNLLMCINDRDLISHLTLQQTHRFVHACTQTGKHTSMHLDTHIHPCMWLLLSVCNDMPALGSRPKPDMCDQPKHNCLCRQKQTWVDFQNLLSMSNTKTKGCQSHLMLHTCDDMFDVSHWCVILIVCGLYHTSQNWRTWSVSSDSLWLKHHHRCKVQQCFCGFSSSWLDSREMHPVA